MSNPSSSLAAVPDSIASSSTGGAASAAANVVVAARAATTFLEIIKTEELGPHDVLCGRGKDCDTYVGNKQFRRVVAPWKEMYTNVNHFDQKAKIARVVLDFIVQAGGRFVRKIIPEERRRVAMDDDTFRAMLPLQLWTPVDSKAAMVKTMQALREKYKVHSGVGQAKEAVAEARSKSPSVGGTSSKSQLDHGSGLSNNDSSGDSSNNAAGSSTVNYITELRSSDVLSGFLRSEFEFHPGNVQFKHTVATWDINSGSSGSGAIQQIMVNVASNKGRFLKQVVTNNMSRDDKVLWEPMDEAAVREYIRKALDIVHPQTQKQKDKALKAMAKKMATVTPPTKKNTIKHLIQQGLGALHQQHQEKKVAKATAIKSTATLAKKSNKESVNTNAKSRGSVNATSKGGSGSSASSSHAIPVIHDLGPTDVVCGRLCDLLPGNVAFNAIVAAHRHDYNNNVSGRNGVLYAKNEVVDRVLTQVVHNQGRFVRPITAHELQVLGLPSTRLAPPCYTLLEPWAVNDKIRRCLRGGEERKNATKERPASIHGDDMGSSKSNSSGGNGNNNMSTTTSRRYDRWDPQADERVFVHYGARAQNASCTLVAEYNDHDVYRIELICDGAKLSKRERFGAGLATLPELPSDLSILFGQHETYTFVKYVRKGSYAEKAGLVQNDVLCWVEDKDNEAERATLNATDNLDDAKPAMANENEAALLLKALGSATAAQLNPENVAGDKDDTVALHLPGKDGSATLFPVGETKSALALNPSGDTENTASNAAKETETVAAASSRPPPPPTLGSDATASAPAKGYNGHGSGSSSQGENGNATVSPAAGNEDNSALNTLVDVANADSALNTLVDVANAELNPEGKALKAASTPRDDVMPTLRLLTESEFEDCQSAWRDSGSFSCFIARKKAPRPVSDSDHSDQKVAHGKRTHDESSVCNSTEDDLPFVPKHRLLLDGPQLGPKSKKARGSSQATVPQKARGAVAPQRARGSSHVVAPKKARGSGQAAVSDVMPDAVPSSSLFDTRLTTAHLEESDDSDWEEEGFKLCRVKMTNVPQENKVLLAKHVELFDKYKSLIANDAVALCRKGRREAPIVAIPPPSKVGGYSGSISNSGDDDVESLWFRWHLKLVSQNAELGGEIARQEREIEEWFENLNREETSQRLAAAHKEKAQQLRQAEALLKRAQPEEKPAAK